jgi:hypothetical protein
MNGGRYALSHMRGRAPRQTSPPNAAFARWSSACARLGSDSDTNDKT